MKFWTRAAMMLAGASALVLGGIAPPAFAHDNGPVTVVMQDRCDPATFNAALQDPNACAPHEDGNVEFTELIGSIAEDPAGVLEDRSVRGWRFHSDQVTVRAGQGLVVTNAGGEAHTFTPVAAFGLGCVDLVNNLFAGLGLTSACGPNAFDSITFPGQTRDPLWLTVGKYRFQCMIHPWMRTDVTVEK